MGEGRLADRGPVPGRRRLNPHRLRRWLLERGTSATADAAALNNRGLETGRILVVRPDHLGDVLFVGPAIEALRRSFPEARITLLIGPWSRPVAELLPGGAAIETLSFPWFDRRPKGPIYRPYVTLLRGALRLRGRFDAALILRDDDWWSALLARVAGIPIRLGHAHPDVSPSLTHALTPSLSTRSLSARSLSAPSEHTAAGNIHLTEALARPGAPISPGAAAHPSSPNPASHPLGLELTEEHLQAARSLLDSVGLSLGVPFLAVHPGSGSAVKRWPTERWAEALRGRPDGWRVVITGSEAEAALASALSDAVGAGAVSVAGQTPLGVLAALYAEARGVVGPDSGPLHLAVATGTPTLHLYGPADWRRFGPWGPAGQHRVLRLTLPCEPCGRLDWPDPWNHPCVTALPVAAVSFALEGLWGSVQPEHIIRGS